MTSLIEEKKTRKRYGYYALSICLFMLVVSSIDAAGIDPWMRKLETSLRNPIKTFKVMAAPDDWTTGGNWRGRYGGFVWILCGMSGSWDYRGSDDLRVVFNSPFGNRARVLEKSSGAGRRSGNKAGSKWKALRAGKRSRREFFRYEAYVGENRDPEDGLRMWVHWPYLPAEVPEKLTPAIEAKARGTLGKMAPAGMTLWEWSDVRRVLLNPVNGGRRQSSWDDHAEGYRPWFVRNGPHLYVDLDFPNGQYLLSFYFVNKDSHWGGVNRFRDHVIQVKKRPAGAWAGNPRFKSQNSESRDPLKRSTTSKEKSGWEKKFEKQPLLAESRVHDFFVGVYKRFVVWGPVKLTVRIEKGDSINTVLSGLFVDEWGGGAGKPQTDDGNAPWLKLLAQVSRMKETFPNEFFRIAPALAGDAGRWEGRLEKESESSYLDRLEALVALFGALTEFDSRDRVWEQYVVELTDWARREDPKNFEGRKATFWNRCEKVCETGLVKSAKLAELYQQYFATTLLVSDRGPALRELRYFVESYAVREPYLARAALIALEATQQPRIREVVFERPWESPPLFKGYEPEELYYWAVCHSQMGDGLTAARHFESFVKRYPKHWLSKSAAKHLKQALRTADRLRRLRNQPFAVAKPGMP